MVLVNPAISQDNPSAVIIFTPLNSPSEITGKPASIASTPNASSFFAIESFCSGDKETPIVCSPSLNVVSNILTFMIRSSAMQQLQFVPHLKFQMALSIPQMLGFDAELQSILP